MLVELSVMEQRYHAVMEVVSGAPVTEVARRYGVSRQAVHGWLGRYEREGLAGLADHSHRPCSSAPPAGCGDRGADLPDARVASAVGAAAAAVRAGQGEGERRCRPGRPSTGCWSAMAWSRPGSGSAAARTTSAGSGRSRCSCGSWMSPASVFLADGTELKLISGIDDHSRFCVIATVVRRATARAVCRAFLAAMRTYGIPDEVLTDNGKQFTGRFGKPRPAEVLFERICRKNGIKQLLTKPYSPTTTGKVERWHQTLQTDFLNDAGPFATIEAAQAAVDAWRQEYNHDRPHQSLDMATPAARFRPSAGNDDDLPLWAPADLQPITCPAPGSADTPAPAEPVSWPDAIEVDRVVPPSGNMTVGPQQFWLGTARAGQKVTVWIDTTTCHLSVGGWRIKTVPSRLSEVDLARLRRTGARPAGPPPAGPSPGALAASRCVEVDRLVNGIGGITLGNRLILVGSPLAGQRARIRLDGQLMHVITQDGVLWRTLPCPIPPGQRHRLQGVRLAGPDPLPEAAATVQRRVSSRGGIQVARQRIQGGMTHAGKIVTVITENNSFRLVIDGETVAVVPRTTSREIGRYKAYATGAPRKAATHARSQARPGRRRRTR